MWPGEIDKSDFLKLLKMLGTKFDEKSYGTEGSFKFQKARNVYEMAIEKNMSKKEFQLYIKKFQNTTQYPKWQESDFFKSKMEKLYTHEQLKDLQLKTGEANTFDKTTAYKFAQDGKVLILYSFSCNLPFDKFIAQDHKIISIQEAYANDDRSKPTEQEKEDFDLAKEYFKIKSGAGKLESKIKGLKLENEVLRNQIKRLKARIPTK